MAEHLQFFSFFVDKYVMARVRFNHFFTKILAIVAYTLWSTIAFGANELAQSFTLDGQLMLAGTTTALTDAAAVLKIDILDPTKTCVLYEETQTVNTVSSDGYFSIQVGSVTGVSKRTSSDPGLTMVQIFQNTSAVTATSASGSTCAGNTYTPVANDVRYFRITVTPSSTNVADVLSPDTTIDAAPMAMVAQTLQGYQATDFLAKAGLPTCSSGTFLSYDGTTLSCAGVSGSNGGTVTSITAGTGLTGGTITASGTIALATSGATAGTYGSTSTVPVVTVDTYGRVTSVTTASISGSPSGSASGDLSGTYPGPTVNGLSGTALSISSLTSGQYLKYNGTNWINSTLSVSDSNITYASEAANTFFAAPNGSAGTPTFRAMVAADLPTVPYTRGGTGLTATPTSGQIPIGNGSGYTLSTLALTNLPSIATGTVLANVSGSADTPTAATPSSVLDTISSTQGSILYRGAAGWSALTPGTSGQYLQTQGASANPQWATVTASGGTVTSVGLSLPSMFTVTNSPVTSTGTLTATLASETANTFLAAPSGSAGSPTFRTIAAADLPTIPVSSGGTGLTSGTQGGIPYYSSSSAMTSTAALTQYGVLYGGGTGAPAATAVGTSGYVLTSNGGASAPTFQQISLASASGTLPIASGGTGATTAAAALTNLGAAANGSNGDITATSILTNISSSTSAITLAPTGNLNLSPSTAVVSSAAFEAPLGSAAAPSYTNSTNPNTGMYFPSSTSLGFATAGANVMTILSSGFVGINKTAPAANLEVDGSSGSTLKIVDGNQASGKVLTSDANGQASWQTASTTPSLPIFGGVNSSFNQDIYYLTQGSGTVSTPWLVMMGTTYNWGGIVSIGGSVDGAASPYIPAAQISFVTTASGTTTAGNGTERMHISGSGNVGVATSTPATILDVSGVTRSTGFDVNSVYGGNQVSIRAPSSFSNYTLTLPTSAGTSLQFLQTDGSGNLSWATATASSSLPALASTDIWVGNSSGGAAAVAMSGDATISNTGVVTVNKTTSAAASTILELNSSSVAVTKGEDISGGGTGVGSLRYPSSSTTTLITLPVGASAVGQVLAATDTAGTLAWTTATATDSTKLPLAGGTMTGAINMGANNITNGGTVAGTTFTASTGLVLKGTTNQVTLTAPTTVTSSYSLSLPTAAPTAGNVLYAATASTLGWTTALTGSVTSSITSIGNSAGTSGGTGSAGTCTFIGKNSGGNGSITGAGNTGVGDSALYGPGSGTNNTAVGANALGSAGTSSGNTAVGAQTMNAGVTGGGNTGIGAQALNDLTSGTDNVAVGGTSSSGALTSITSGSNNIGIGYNADPGSNVSNSTTIGNSSTVTTSLNGGAYSTAKALVVGTTTSNGDGANLTSAGVWTNASDRRIKKNIIDLQYGLDEIMNLRPVHYNMIGTDEPQVGFIAQEVYKVVPEVVELPEKPEQHWTMSYGNLVAVVVKAMQQQQGIIEEQKRQISSLQETHQQNLQQMELMRQYLCAKDPTAPFCTANNQTASPSK